MVKIEEEKTGKTITTVRMEYVDANLDIRVVDKVNDNPISGIAVFLFLDPNLTRLESVTTSDSGVAEFKNVGYLPIEVSVRAKSRG